MPLCQVYHMDIVPHACSVMGFIIISEYIQVFPLAHRNLGYIGHEVIGNTAGVLAYSPAFMGPDGVEIP